MSSNTVEKFKIVEKELKKMVSLLVSAKDENTTLKNRLKELEVFKNSASKGKSKNQKVVSDYESLRKKYEKILKEKVQLRNKVDQMLKKVDCLQLT